jgi:hypothetical protein
VVAAALELALGLIKLPAPMLAQPAVSMVK